MPPRHSVWLMSIPPTSSLHRALCLSSPGLLWFSQHDSCLPNLGSLSLLFPLPGTPLHYAYDHLVWSRHPPLVSISDPCWFPFYALFQTTIALCVCFLVYCLFFPLYGIYHHQMSLMFYLLAFLWILFPITWASSLTGQGFLPSLPDLCPGT